MLKFGILIDGVEMNRLHPDTFEIPDALERCYLERGDLVKIGLTHPDNGGERFWVNVLESHASKNNHYYVGAIDNDLVDYDFPYGSKIFFGPEHVLRIFG